MVKQPILSIIIPIYNNLEHELSRCLDSICHTEYDPFIEILCIDDGSEHPEVLDRVVEEFPNAHVYHKENGGTSSARNFGMMQAKGQYVSFVDADDVITSHMLAEVFATIRDFKPDIVYGYVLQIRVDAFKESLNRIAIKSSTARVLSDEDRQTLYDHMCCFDAGQFIDAGSGAYISRGPIARVVKREAACNCLFTADVPLGEDEIWNISLLRNNKHAKVMVMDSVWYLYMVNTRSATRRYRPAAISDEKRRMSILDGLLGDTREAELGYLNKTYGIMSEICNTYYFHDECPVPYWQKPFDFYRLQFMEPWGRHIQWRKSFDLGTNGIVKWFLLRTGLLYFTLLILKCVRR